MNKPNSNRVCRECGEPFLGRKAHAAFCSTTCRKTWNNRRATRGAQLYDAVMAMRYDREKAKELGIDWTFVCRMAEMWNGEDDRRRAIEMTLRHKWYWSPHCMRCSL